ncbi:MAG: TonB family protein [Rikenellaceae bacterium]|nr:TonB family protein [Rikenellaceae bacterium]
MKKLFFTFIGISVFMAFQTEIFAQQPQTIYARGDNQLPEGYTHASFNGGGLLDFKIRVSQEISLPEEFETGELSGRVIVSLIVNEKGRLEEVEVLSSPHPVCSTAVLEAIGTVPGKWKPGRDPKGKRVRIRYLLPVEFAFDGRENTATKVNPDHIPVGTMPSFQKGDLTKFREWVISRTEYPSELKKESIKGNVVVTFVIERDGSITDVQVLSGLHPLLDREAVRAVEESPDWEPGLDENGNPVRVRMNMPVSFGK